MGEQNPISPTKNTSGAGFSFEDRIVAFFLLDLLLERSFGIEDVVDERLIEVGVQREPDGWLLDDLLLRYQHLDGERLVAAEVKGLPLLSDSTKRDRVFSDAWHDALAIDRKPRSLILGHDYLGIFTSRNRPEDFSSVDEIIRKGREQDDDFFRRVSAPGHILNGAIWLDRLDCPEELAKEQNVTDAIRRKFIGSLSLREFDFDLKHSENERQVVELSSYATVSESRDDGLALWQTLCSIAQKLRRDGGQIDRSRLIAKLPGSLRLKQVPRLAESWMRLLSDCERDRKQQRCSIGSSISLQRIEILDAVVEKIESGSVALIGPSGSGKSTLASMLAERLAVDRTVIWMNPKRILAIAACGGRVQDGSPNTLSNLIAQAVSSRGVVIIDGIDQLTGLNQWRDLSQILRDVADQSAEWRVIITAQDEQWYRVRSALSAEGVDVRNWTTQAVGTFNSTELAQILATYPQLLQLVSQTHLQGIIQRPRILDLLVRSIDDGVQLPTVWVGETKLIEWYWETRVRMHGLAVSSSLKELARRQADEFELDTSFKDLATSTADAQQIVAGGFLRENNERFTFEHDSLGDWARLQWLVSQGANLNSAIQKRYDNPRWHRALRLLACQKLEASSSIDEWASLFDSCREFRDFALDGLLFAAGTKHYLEKVSPRLLANDGELLKKTLRRALVVCTVPNERLIEQVRQKKRSPTPFLRVYSRDPMPFVWHWTGLFQFLLDHCDEVYEVAAVEAAKATRMWLEMTPLNWPARHAASQIAFRHSERLHEERLEYRWSRDADEDAVQVYRSALIAFPEDRERGRGMYLQACSRAVPPKIASREIAAELPGDELGESALAPGKKLVQPEPWLHGPQFHVDAAFREACLEHDAMDQLFEFEPALAAEILLALLIDVRKPVPPDEYRDAYGPRSEQFGGLIHPRASLSMPHAQTGPFWTFLVYSSHHAIDFTLKLVNFASERSHAKPRVPGNARTVSIQSPFANQQHQFGSENALYWNRGYAGACVRAVAPLVALEAWLVAHLDKGNPVEKYLDQIITGARSTAFLGLLADVARKHPRLFDGKLRPLLTSPILLIWDETVQNASWRPRIGAPDTSRTEEFFEQQKAWISAAYRDDRLTEHSENRLPPTDLQWEELSPYVDPDVFSTELSQRFIALRTIASQRLAAWLGSAGSSFRTKNSDDEKDSTNDPPPPPARDVDNFIATIRGVQRFLISGDRLDSESVIAIIESGPNGAIQSDDPKVVILQRMAELAKATYLLVNHPDDLRKADAYDRYLQFACAATMDTDFFGTVMRGRLANYYTYPYWLASVAFDLWKQNLNDKLLRRWIAHLACYSAGDAKSEIVTLSFGNREVLGGWHRRLIHLLLKWSAAWWELTSTEAQFRPHPSFDFNKWWSGICAEFSEGQLMPIIPSLDDLYLRDRPLLCAHWRHHYGDEDTFYKAPPVDCHSVLTAIFRGTPLSNEAETPEAQVEIAKVLRLVVDCHLIYLEVYDQNGTFLSSSTDDYPQLSFDAIVIDRIVEELNSVSDPNEIVVVWGPVLGLGITAPLYVEHLISKWLWPLLSSDQVPLDFELKWRCLLSYCSKHQNWTSLERNADVASLWAHLIGIDSSAFRFWRPDHKGIADRATDIIEAPLELIVKEPMTAGPALRWISRGVGERYQLLALTWTSDVIDELIDPAAPEDQLALSMAEFLCEVWRNHQHSITTSPPYANAFRRALRTTAGSGCELAVDLEQRIGVGNS